MRALDVAAIEHALDGHLGQVDVVLCVEQLTSRAIYVGVEGEYATATALDELEDIVRPHVPLGTMQIVVAQGRMPEGLLLRLRDARAATAGARVKASLAIRGLSRLRLHASRDREAIRRRDTAIYVLVGLLVLATTMGFLT